MPLEGVLGPNRGLDDAEGYSIASPDAICVNRHGQLLVSSGSTVLLVRQWGQEPEHWGSFDAPVSALAVSAGGRVAVGLADGRVVVREAAGERLPGWNSIAQPARRR